VALKWYLSVGKQRKRKCPPLGGPWWASGYSVWNAFVHDMSEYCGIVPPVAKDYYLNKSRVMSLEGGDNPYANGWTIWHGP